MAHFLENSGISNLPAFAPLDKCNYLITRQLPGSYFLTKKRNMYTKHIFRNIFWKGQYFNKKPIRNTSEKKQWDPNFFIQPAMGIHSDFPEPLMFVFFPRRSQSSAALWRLTPWRPLGVREVVLKHTRGVLGGNGWVGGISSIPSPLKNTNIYNFKFRFIKAEVSKSFMNYIRNHLKNMK